MARGRFKSLSVSDTVYNKLREIAERRGFTTLADTVAYLVSLEELVVRRLESITSSTGNVTGNSGNVTTSAGNVTSSTGNVTGNAGNVKTSSNTITADEGHEWCWSKTKVRSLQDFIKWVDGRFGLIDWWDEGDRYCFKTKKKPA
jgi:hypothetical protein